jgi:hypothetical protein
MLKNTENQKWIVFAFDSTTGLAKTGDAAQITANLRKDYGDAAALTDTNPTELEDGFYSFDLSQAETNADHLLICPVSSTSNIVVIGCPSVIFTEPTGRKYPATLAAADVSGNIPVDVTAIQSGLATSDNQATIINNQGTINSNISGIPAAVWAVSTRTLTSFGTLVADIAAAVWGYLTSALTVTGSIGKLLTDNIDAPISEAGGGSGLDAAGVRAAVGLSTANLDTQLSTINSNVDAILVDTSTTIPALINADSGAGAISWTYTLTDSDDGTPIDGAEVWATTDAAGEDVVASGTTDSFGVVTFMLDAGAYYFWRKCSGYNFNNPDLETVS